MQKTRIPERRKAAFKAAVLNMENTLFYIFLFLIYPVLMFGTVLFCSRKKEEEKPEMLLASNSEVKTEDMNLQNERLKRESEITFEKDDFSVLEDDEDDQFLDLMKD